MSPDLYAALARTRGAIRTTKRGDLFRRAAHGVVADWGELYNFDCPFCGDSKKRAWVSYMYGQPDPRTGRPMYELVGCWNEDCFASRRNRDGFAVSLMGLYVRGLEIPVFGPPDESGGRDGRRTTFAMPGWCRPVAELHAGHEARRYLEGRGYDPDVVGPRFGLSYCLQADHDLSIAEGRLIIPVRRGGELVGWQARRLDGRKRLKYFTCPGMATGRTLYNQDLALAGPVVVLVEGVVDVWSVGPAGAALFGHTLSDAKRDLILGAAPARPWVVVLLDAGEKGADPGAIARALEPGFPGRVVVASIPLEAPPGDLRRPLGPGEKPDPGSLTTGAVWRCIRAAGAAAGGGFLAAVEAARPREEGDQ